MVPGTPFRGMDLSFPVSLSPPQGFWIGSALVVVHGDPKNCLFQEAAL